MVLQKGTERWVSGLKSGGLVEFSEVREKVYCRKVGELLAFSAERGSGGKRSDLSGSR